MKETDIEVLRQIVSRTDKTGNEKVEMLVEFVEKQLKNCNLPQVSVNEVVAIPSDGVSVIGCPYRVQDSCNFRGQFCTNETCNIRAKPVTER